MAIVKKLIGSMEPWDADDILQRGYKAMDAERSKEDMKKTGPDNAGLENMGSEDKGKQSASVPILSVIVPVYNAEEALRRCVDSILDQDWKDLELILVDDGSRDSSGDICDEYAKKDGRVRVIHKPNSGVSDSRNRALDMARGKYIQFADSDDWIAHDASAELLRTAEEHGCDMVISDFYRVVGKRVQQKGNIDEEGVFSREQYAEYMMEDPADFYYGVLWNKLYRRELIELHGLRMDPKVRWCEDFMFNLEYILHAETFCAVHKPLYYYVKTKGSLVSQSMSLPKLVRMKAAVFEYYQDFYKNVFSEEEYQKARLKVYSFLIDGAGDGFSPVAGSRKLAANEEELCEELLSGDAMESVIYRQEKLLEELSATASMRYDVSLDEIKLLLMLSRLKDIYTRMELADMTGLGITGITRCLTTLSFKKLIRYKDQMPSDRDYSFFGPHTLSIELLSASKPLMEELKKAEEAMEKIYTKDMTDEEKDRFLLQVHRAGEAAAAYLREARQKRQKLPDKTQKKG